MVEKQLINSVKVLIKDFINKCYSEELFTHLENAFDILSFSSRRRWTKIMLQPVATREIVLKSSKKLRIIGGGILAGWMWKGKFIPSPHLYNFIYDNYQKIGCAVSSKPQGVRAFLYGNDLLLVSLEKVLPPIEKGKYIAVIDSEDFKAIGIGMMLYSEDEIAELIKRGQMLTAIVKNVFDLGIHVRDEMFFI
jgi:predicted ribosome-associated RNA-binding protein Tma20|uniref:UPF0113 domain-containing protein n=1 Tax=Ignisphaera aggregans TaxID=334771 RepID=A0A7J2U022_9CREN